MAENGTVTADGYTGKVEYDGSTIRIERPGLRGKIGYGGAASAINANTVTRVSFTGAPSEEGFRDSARFGSRGCQEVLVLCRA